MKTVAILNIKGGVAKTTSALAIAQILAQEHGKRVLVVDADQQGNATNLLLDGASFTVGTADMLIAKEHIPTAELIRHTAHGVDLIGADFGLMGADRQCMLDTMRPQQFRFSGQLMRPEIYDSYDFCIVDCPPDINMATINTLAIADEVLFPVRADKFALDGMGYALNVIEQAKEYNRRLNVGGCFLTVVDKRANLTSYMCNLMENIGLPAMKTTIRACTKVGESSFTRPLISYAPTCTAAQDYRALVSELIERGILA